MIEAVVDGLCALTSLICAWMLIRGYRKNPGRLVLWSAVCFGGFALNNVILVIDDAIGDLADLSLLRYAVFLASLAALLYGLVWEVA